MKFISKGLPPKVLQDWLNTKIDLTYDNMPVKKEVLETLMQEQGNICAYTMVKLNKYNAHIEHFKPQSLYLEECLNYMNMLACLTHKDFGAVLKGSQDPTALGLINPLSKNCEQSFQYKESGAIHGHENSIRTLGLDNPILANNRRDALREAGLSRKSKRPKTAQELRRFINLLQHETKEFHVALLQVAKTRLAKEEYRKQTKPHS